MNDSKDRKAAAEPPLDCRVMPTLADWLAEQGIEMTPSEMVDCIFAAQRRKQTVGQFLGYPWA